MTARSFFPSLRRLSPKLYRALTWLGVAELVVLLAGAGLLSFFFDRALELPFFLRLCILLGAVYLFVRLFRRARARLRQPLEVRDLVAAVETHNPELEGHLASALELPGECQRLRAAGKSTLEIELAERALAEAREAAARARWAGALDVAPVGRAVALAAILAGIFVAGALCFPRAFSLWFERNVLLASTPWPRSTHFVFEHEGKVWHQARGEPLEVAFWAAGKLPAEVRLELRSGERQRVVRLSAGQKGFVPLEALDRLRQSLRAGDRLRGSRRRGNAGKNAGSVPQVRAGTEQDGGQDGPASGALELDSVPGMRFSYNLAAVSEALEIQASGGDNQSDVVTVEVHDRPRILSTRFVLRFPDYLKREPQEIDNPAGEVSVPAGTEIAVAAKGDVELAGGWVRYGGEEKPPQELAAAGDSVEYRFTPEATGFLDLAVRDRIWGLESRPALRFGVLVLPDAEPTIRFELAGESRRMTPAGRIAYRVAAEDDHGFSRLWLARTERGALDERADEELPVTTQELDATAVEAEGRFAARAGGDIDLAPLKLEPGTTLTLQAFASDNDALGGPKTAASQREAVLIVDTEAFRAEMEKLRLEAQARVEALARREETVAALLEAEAGAAPERSEGAAASAAASSASGGTAGTPAPGRSSGEERAGAAPGKGEPVRPEAAAGRREAAAASEARPPQESGAPEPAVAREGEEGPARAAGERNEGRQDPGRAASQESRPDRGAQAAAGTRSAEASTPASGEQASSGTSSSPQETRPGGAQASSRPTARQDLRERLAGEQAEAAREAAEVGESLQQMVEALKRNELLSPAEERRFQDEVAKPLDELAGERLPRSAGAIRSLARQEGAEGDAARAGKQAQAVTRMAEDLKEVSRQLAGGGDFREILGRMELIIELQREVIQKTETMENRPKDEKGGEK